MRLSQTRPDEVLRAAALLGMSADDILHASAIAQRSSTVSWHGPPSQQFQHRLAELVTHLTAVRRAFDAAAEAVLAYGRELDVVRQQAVTAEALCAEADRRVLVDAIAFGTAHATLPASQAGTLGPGPFGMASTFGAAGAAGAGVAADVRDLRSRAEALLADAEQRHAAAAARVVLALRDLAARAPRHRVSTSIDRGLGHVADVMQSTLEGPFVVARDVVRAAHGDSRGLTTDLEALLPWTAVEDVISTLHQHEWSTASGETLSIVLLRGRVPKPEHIVRYGAHDAMDLDVLATMFRGVFPGRDLDEVHAWLATHGQQAFLHELLRLQHLPTPDLDTLISTPVNLMHHDARGGHTLIRHIGRDADFLRQRQIWHPGRRGNIPMSSFASLAEANSLVTGALATIRAGDANYTKIVRWLQSPRRRVIVYLPLVGPEAGLLVDELGTAVAATSVRIRLVRDRSGGVVIESAHLDKE